MANSQQEKEFRIIFESHYNSMCRIAFRILKEKDTAREIVQEVFIEIWKKQNWNELKSVQAYLFTATYNRSLKALTKQKRLVSLDSIEESGAIDSQSDSHELEVLISQAIDRLPERCKEIFILSREDNMTYNQIAVHLNISIKTVEGQMGIALKKLRSYLQTHGH